MPDSKQIDTVPDEVLDSISNDSTDTRSVAEREREAEAHRQQVRHDAEVAHQRAEAQRQAQETQQRAHDAQVHAQKLHLDQYKDGLLGDLLRATYPNLTGKDSTLSRSEVISLGYAEWKLQGNPQDPRYIAAQKKLSNASQAERDQARNMGPILSRYNNNGETTARLIQDGIADIRAQGAASQIQLNALAHRAYVEGSNFKSYQLPELGFNFLSSDFEIKHADRPHTNAGQQLRVENAPPPATPPQAEAQKPSKPAGVQTGTPQDPKDVKTQTHAHTTAAGPAVIRHHADKAKPDMTIAPATIGDDGNGEVHFATGSDKLNDDGIKAIMQIAEKLKARGATHISLTGHTDTVGSDDINNQLSQRRAESVMVELKKHGITADMEAHGVGKTQLEVKTAQGVANAINRSVEIKTDASTPIPTAAPTPTPPVSSVDTSAGANTAACPPGQTEVLSDTDKANVDRITDDMAKRGKDTMDFTDANGKPFSPDQQQAIAAEVKHHLQETRRSQMKLTFGHMAEAQQAPTAYQERFNMNMDRGSLKCLNSKAAAANGLAQQAHAADDTSPTTVATSVATSANKGVAAKVAVPAN